MGIFDIFKASTTQQKSTDSSAALNAYIRSMYRWFGNDQPLGLPPEHHTFINSYQSVGAVYSGLSLILNKLSACPVLVYKVKDEQQAKKYYNLVQSPYMEQKAQAMLLKSRVFEEVTHKDIQKILDRPNSTQDMADIIELLSGALVLNGNHYVFRNGPNPKANLYNEIYCLPPQETEIISGGMYDPVKGYRISYMEEILPIAQVTHGKTYNPDWSSTGSQLYGQSFFRASLSPIQRLKLGEAEINKQLKNGGTLGVVSPKNVADYWTKEQGDAFKERLKEAKGSEDEVSRIVAGAVPLDFMKIGLTIADMELMDLMGMTKEEIYQAMHIPLQYLNQEGSSYNNKSEAGKELVYNALDPIARRVAKTLTRSICDPVYERTGERYIIQLDTSSLPEMGADMKELATWLDKSWWITPNQKLEAMGWGKSDAENMDIPIVPKTLTRIDQLHLTEEGFNSAIEKETEE